MTIARSVASPVASPVARPVASVDGGVTYSEVVADALGNWPLQDDAASTDVNDIVPFAFDATLVGGNNTEDITTTGPNAVFSKALNMDGTSDYITTVQTTPLTEFSAAVWAKYAAGTTIDYKHMLAKGDVFLGAVYEFALYLRPHPTAGSAGIGCFFHDGTTLRNCNLANPAASGITWTDWNHYAVTIKSGSQVFYVNGVSVCTSAFAVGVGSANEIRIGNGRGSNPAGDPWLGPLASAIVWNRFLSPAEIALVAEH